MNVFIFFLAGFSAGWVTDKLYHKLVFKKSVLQCGNGESEDVSSAEVEEESVVEAVEEQEAEEQEAEEQEAEERRDDLGQLKGVGPKLTQALDDIGIYNYEQLSNSSVDDLLERLRETGGRFSRPVIASVLEQAKLLD